MCRNVCDDVIDFKFMDSPKTQKCEYLKNEIVSSYKNIHSLHIKDHNMVKNYFLAEVTLHFSLRRNTVFHANR